jgi:serine/threonine protein kinase
MNTFDKRKPTHLKIIIPKNFDDILDELNYNFTRVFKKSPTKWVGLCQVSKEDDVVFVKIYNGIHVYKGDLLINDIKKSKANTLINFITAKNIEIIDNYNILKIPYLGKNYKTIHQHLKFGSFNEYDIYQIIKQMISSFNELWANNLVHNDINATNLMYSKKNTKLKIIDFEISAIKNNDNYPQENISFLTLIIYILVKYLKLNNKIIKTSNAILNNFNFIKREKIVKVYRNYFDVFFNIFKNCSILFLLRKERKFFYKKINSLLLI